MRRAPKLACAVALLAALAPAAASAAPRWHEVRVDPPPPPPGVPGAPFPVPLGAVGDIAFWAPNRGLMAVEGNNVVPKGVYVWNGQRWRPYASVCGARADKARIAWAGPTEFWTVADVRPEVGAVPGASLCLFRGGRVERSLATPRADPNGFVEMDAAACASPTECWFGGLGLNVPRQGAFHLRWDGASLEQVAGQQGRGISDIATLAGRWYETTFLGKGADDRGEVQLTFPEPQPKLLHRLISGNYRNDPFTPASLLDPSKSAVELHALGVDGGRLWVVGGPAASGPEDARRGTLTGPVLGRLVSGAVVQAPITGATFSPDESFLDVAPIPGTGQAWVAVARFDARTQGGLNAGRGGRARLVRLREDGTVLEDVTLPAPGAALRVACAAADDCWAGTLTGLVWRWSEPGKSYAPDQDQAFTGPTIEDRPPDGSLPQFTPDAPPIDDSLLFAPPPEPDPPPQAAPPPARAKRVPALLSRIKVKRRGLRIEIGFRLARRARVQFTGRDRRNRVIARTKRATLRPGTHELTMRASRRKWPRRIRYTFHDLAPPPGLGPDDRPLDGSGGDQPSGGNDVVISGGPG